MSAMETLYYVRHGTSEFNLERRFGGSTDTLLAPEGFEQARLAGARAAALRIDCIVSSPLSRCRSTAGIIAEAIGYPIDEVIVSELLIERHFGPLEGTPLRPDIDGVEGVESEQELLTRAWRAYEFLCGIEARHLLVCSHGMFGRALRSTFHPALSVDQSVLAPGAATGIPNAVITCWRRGCDCCAHEELAPV
jgi:broad specificity phosphatase PhoE